MKLLQVIIHLLIAVIGGYSLRLGLLIPEKPASPGSPSYQSSAGAFQYALSSNPSVSTAPLIEYTSCKENIALDKAVKFKDKVDVIIGPVCQQGKHAYIDTFRCYLDLS